jgi:hypothetical protein
MYHGEVHRRIAVFDELLDCVSSAVRGDESRVILIADKERAA